MYRRLKAKQNIKYIDEFSWPLLSTIFLIYLYIVLLHPRYAGPGLKHNTMVPSNVTMMNKDDLYKYVIHQINRAKRYMYSR